VGAELPGEEAPAELIIVSKLVLHVPGGGMRNIPLDRDRITIGRRADNDVCLQYPAVSADHAEIVTVGGDSFLHDSGSTNGTLVNGQRVVKHFLQDRDMIDVGRVQLVYVVDDDELIAPLDTGVTLTSARTGTGEPSSVGALASDVVEQAADKYQHNVAHEQSAPADELLAELMESHSDSAVAVEIPPTISMVPATRGMVADEQESHTDATLGVYVEVMNGPNAGQIAPMTKREFVLGQSGATKAVIKRNEERFVLVPVDPDVVTSVNGERVRGAGVGLAFGDTIDVAGVVLRFGRRPPL